MRTNTYIKGYLDGDAARCMSKLRPFHPLPKHFVPIMSWVHRAIRISCFGGEPRGAANSETVGWIQTGWMVWWGASCITSTPESCHDANFVVIGCTYVANSDDQVASWQHSAFNGSGYLHTYIDDFTKVIYLIRFVLRSSSTPKIVLWSKREGV